MTLVCSQGHARQRSRWRSHESNCLHNRHPPQWQRSWCIHAWYTAQKLTWPVVSNVNIIALSKCACSLNSIMCGRWSAIERLPLYLSNDKNCIEMFCFIIYWLIGGLATRASNGRSIFGGKWDISSLGLQYREKCRWRGTPLMQVLQEWFRTIDSPWRPSTCPDIFYKTTYIDFELLEFLIRNIAMVTH